MPPSKRCRLDPAIFRLPVEELRAGTYSDAYFNRAREILRREDLHPRVRMQVFARSAAVLCGIDEALAILRTCSGADDGAGGWSLGWDRLAVRALYDGDAIEPWETVLTIEGDYDLFAHLETCCLGVLSRRTRVATHGRALVDAAGTKPVLHFAARYDHHAVQSGDGYAARVAGAAGVSTDANARWFGGRGIGTMPHALIAAYGGDTVRALLALAQDIEPAVDVIALVDYDNDCVAASLACARALGARLWGVRLDTAQTLVDRSVLPQMGSFAPTGVNPQLVHNVRDALDAEGFAQVKIVASGGFDAATIRAFERAGVPVDAYAVGSAYFANDGAFDFTADIVAREVDGAWTPCHKVGRLERPSPRLTAAP